MMSDTDQLNELIKEIATKHGIVVSRDDPILILQTINNRLLLDSKQAQSIMLDQYKEELENLSSRWGTEVKTKAERILNATILASKAASTEILNTSATQMSALIQAEVANALSATLSQLKTSKKISIWNLVAAGLTLLSVISIVIWH